MKPAIYALIFSLLVPVWALAQGKTGQYQNYEYGKKLLQNKQYAEAAGVFQAISQEIRDNPYRKNAFYLHAYAAYQTGNYPAARLALQDLERIAPDWPQQDDLHYLAAAIELSTQSYEKGINHLKLIQSPTFQPLTDSLIKVKLARTTIEEKESLYRRSGIRIIAEMLYAQLINTQKTSFYPALFTELQGLISPENIKTQPKWSADEQVLLGVSQNPAFKSQYNIAVILPFELESTLNSQFDANMQRFYDLYGGARVAANLLNEEQMPVQIHAFDSGKDSLQTRKLFNDPAFNAMDMIIGPLYQSSVAAVSNYSIQQQKIMVNPISSNRSLTLGNPFSFLLSATLESQVKSMVDYAVDSLQSRKVYILQNGTASDAEVANLYRAAFEKRGGTVVQDRPFDFGPKGFNNLLQSLQSFSKDTTNHVFVCSGDNVMTVNLLSALQNIQSRVAIFGHSQWLFNPQVSLQQLEKMRVFIYYPQYVDTDMPNAKLFANRYVKLMSIPPSPYAYAGFEAVYQFGKALHQFGSGLAGNIHARGFAPGFVYLGFDYSQANDNQFVPILRMSNGDLQIVNLPTVKP